MAKRAHAFQIDGVESLNNVLLIGMTNRKDLLDEALLRCFLFLSASLLLNNSLFLCGFILCLERMISLAANNINVMLVIIG